MKVQFIGATHEVTGSCTLLEVNGRYYLVDCGMEQGEDIFQNVPLPVPANAIEAVFLTHAHIDHSGMLPKLCKDGFRGQIYATEATCNLCRIMLMDSAHIQESEAQWRTRKAERAGERAVEPVYDTNDAAAALRAEYTLPNVSQTVIITRAAGRTPVPERESIRSLAAHQATMVLFLSTSLTEKLQGELLAGGYGETTPAAVVYKATWPEEKIFRCTVGTLHKTVTENGMKKTALIVVGGCLGGEYLRSLLYHPDFTTEYRKGKA